MRRLELPYGSRPLHTSVPDDAVVVEPPSPPPAQPLGRLLSDALDRPLGAPPLRAGGRAVVVVSDSTRHEPRDEMVSAVLSRLGDADITLAIANGTHGACELSRLGLDASLLARATVVNHDADDDTQLVLLGTTRRGTPLRVNRCLVEADQLVATGRIKPHYFAGFGAGAKAFFPGLGGNREIRMNHRLKAEPGASSGVVEGNPCREDLEEILDALPVRPFLLNVVTDAAGGAQAAVAGDVRDAFRRGAELCAPLYRVDLPEADVIVVSDELPLSGSLYQASKLVAAVAPRLRPGGHIILAAECPEGIGPLRVVNEAIYEIGLKPRLPAEHTVHLVSSLPAATVERSYCTHAPSVESVLERVGGRRIAVLPRAGDIILSS